VTGTFVAAVAHETALKWGAFAFGSVIGWNIYFINRYRKDVVIGDLSAVITAVGGSAILALFPAKSLMFAFYGLGLAAGFFAYFLILIILVIIEPTVGILYIITGKTGDRPMIREPDAAPAPPGPPAPPEPSMPRAMWEALKMYRAPDPPL
jgi:hypothetical protein